MKHRYRIQIITYAMSINRLDKQTHKRCFNIPIELFREIVEYLESKPLLINEIYFNNIENGKIKDIKLVELIYDGNPIEFVVDGLVIKNYFQNRQINSTYLTFSKKYCSGKTLFKKLDIFKKKLLSDSQRFDYIGPNIYESSTETSDEDETCEPVNIKFNFRVNCEYGEKCIYDPDDCNEIITPQMYDLFNNSPFYDYKNVYKYKMKVSYMYINGRTFNVNFTITEMTPIGKVYPKHPRYIRNLDYKL